MASPEPPGYMFVKGHGTENDFVLLPDLDGEVHGELSTELWADRVRALCDRHAGIGGDGVLRVVRTAAYDAGTGIDPGEAEFFMDYRNADGLVAQMCGNGLRVFVRWLLTVGAAAGTDSIDVGTRDGIKRVSVQGELLTADMGTPKLRGETPVAVGGRSWRARHVDMGNPHAVAFVEDLADAGALLEPPAVHADVYPEGVNVEFVVRRGDRHVAMRVHERGSGETRSCGTGACAVMVATALADGNRPQAGDVTYRVDVSGGTLAVTWTIDDRVLLTGPAVLVASGRTDL